MQALAKQQAEASAASSGEGHGESSSKEPVGALQRFKEAGAGLGS